MKHRYLEWTVMVLAVEVVALFGLYRSIGAGSNEDAIQSNGQGLRKLQTSPSVQVPSPGVAGLSRQADNQHPGGGTP